MKVSGHEKNILLFSYKRNTPCQPAYTIWTLRANYLIPGDIYV